MTYSEAITRADRLRPNAIEEEDKVAWLVTLEGDVAEQMGVAWSAPECPNDEELLMAAPYDNIYELFVAAMIDNQHEEVDLYQNDMAIFNAARDRAFAAWRRGHRHIYNPDWRTM